MARLLVVDDEAPLRLLFKISLEKLGHQIDVAEHGGHAIRMLDESKYDLVISDMAMPVADGMDVLAAALTHNVPVIICSSYLTDDSRDRARSLGATMLLEKPISPSLLAEAVGTIVK